MGTSFYMSPEQCTGASVDRRTDIYSLACVMYEVLSGKPPFIGESSYEVMFKQLNSSLSKLGELKRLPKSLAAFLTRCLQKDP
ncbi:MAG: protein kinase, partial [Candidatus Obscuribacterales bacterium]|nr:protein kinase [Candidatus Obscuribacterales bacterium]